MVNRNAQLAQKHSKISNIVKYNLKYLAYTHSGFFDKQKGTVFEI